jgi:hypothetical protein
MIRRTHGKARQEEKKDRSTQKRGVHLLHGMLGQELDIHSYWKTLPLDCYGIGLACAI